MDLFQHVTFDQIGLSFLMIFTIREAVIFVLPDDIAGPGGRLIDTGIPDCEY